MSYCLRAFIGNVADLEGMLTHFKNASVTRLDDGFGLLPVSDDLWKGLEKDQKWDESGQCEECGYEERSIIFTSKISRSGTVGFIVAEFFGGDGCQWAILCRDGEPILGPIHTTFVGESHLPRSEWPINRILRALGVIAHLPQDEFESIGLQAHRHTEEWGFGVGDPLSDP